MRDSILGKRVINDDSSDEEEVAQQNGNYDLYQAINETDFIQLAQQFGDIEPLLILKSFILHTLGKMLIYAPEIEQKYNRNKKNLLNNDSSSKRTTLDKQQTIRTNSLNIEINSLEDLLALGRLLKRSQTRLYRNLKDKQQEEEREISAEITFTNKQKIVLSKVTETLVASSKGLSRPRNNPKSDIVDLRLETGDYLSAYQGNHSNYGKEYTYSVVYAAKQYAQNADEYAEDINSAITTITLLQDEIIQTFPKLQSDRFLASCMQNICQGRPLFLMDCNQDIQNRIYALTYLLFKTEIFRSPAALISHLQILDLISSDEMSFAEAFKQQEMPMSISGALKAARQTDNIFNQEKSFHPFSNYYEYSSKKNTKKDNETIYKLIEKEAALFDKWINFHLQELVIDNLEDFKQNLPKICHKLSGTFSSYGLNLHSNSLHNLSLPNHLPESFTKQVTNSTQNEQSL